MTDVEEPLATGDRPLDREEVWGSGDRATWLWIGAMCAFGLLIAVIAYLLPAGRTSYLPPIKLY